MIVIILVIIVILYLYFRNGSINGNNIKTLITQSARYSLAAKQDKNDIIALLHANYGAAYLYAVRDIYRDSDIERYANIDILDYSKKIKQIQREVTMRVASKCKIINIDTELERIAGY